VIVGYKILSSWQGLQAPQTFFGYSPGTFLFTLYVTKRKAY